MEQSNKSGRHQNNSDKSKRILLASVLGFVTISIIISTVLGACGTVQKPIPAISSDLTFTGSESSDSRNTSLESPVITDTSSQPVNADVPPSSETTDRTEKPATTEKTVTTSKPVTTAKPSTTTRPATTVKPTTTKKPTTTSKPTTEKPKEPQVPGTVPSSIESAVRILLDSMSLEEKVYQLFIVAPEQLSGSSKTVTQSSAAISSALQSYPVGGVIFFGGNIQTPDQTTKLIADLQRFSSLGLFIAVDEEGGTVARLGRNSKMGTTAFPPMGEIGASGDTERARNVGLTIGKDLKRFGFNLDFAPVADVNSNPNNPVIKERAFSNDPHVAADMVAACVSGFKESGVLCTLKHFPGHGDTLTDSHYGSASSGKTLEELIACEFLPFEAGIAAGADIVMIGHIALPNVTGNDLPATLSYEITTGILREMLGFEGLIVTDSMSMAAITSRFSSGEAAVKAIQAGADIILKPDDLADAAKGVLTAVKNGEISEERLNQSVYRILYAKLAQGIIPMSIFG